MALRIDEWRRAKKITQEQLAERCDVHAMTIRAWEKHPEKIQIKYVDVICQALGVERQDVIFLPYESN